VSVYLDHAATTPMLPQARDVLIEALGQHGNASSLHTAGRSARAQLEESRELLARHVGADPHEVIFTAGGTEADNLALKGLFWQRRAEDPRRVRLLVPDSEHPAVLEVVEWLEAHQGAQWVRLPVDAVGRVRLEVLAREIEKDPTSVALVAVMAANNEVGTTQPLDAVVALAAAHGIPVHCDAVQALPWQDVDFAASGLDSMALSAHKVGGPVGVGALLLKRGLELAPLLHGGGQERQIRSGTVNVPGAASFAAAVEWTARHRELVSARVAALRLELVCGVLEAVPDAVLQGDDAFLRGASTGQGRVVNNAHFTFPCCEGDSLLYLLDARGIEASTGSACQAGVPQPSHVLLAMGLTESEATGALRFSLGVTTTRQDVLALLGAIRPVVQRAASAGLAGVASAAKSA
jgi:cysteine desulfurase